MTTEANEYRLPKEAQDAADLAEQLHAKLFPAATPLDEEAATPVVEPPAEVVEPVVVEPPPVDPELKFEDKYKSLKGKYDAEVPRLATELRELKATLAQRSTPATPAVVEEQASPLLSRIEALRTEYGDELVEDWKALIATEIQTAIKPIHERATQVEKAQEKITQDEFRNALTSRSANWEDKWDSVLQAANGETPINQDFVDFLDTSDPQGLYTYGELLAKANTEWDVDRIAKIFNIFEGLGTPGVIPDPIPEPVVPVNPARQALVAPSRTNTTAVPAITAPHIWDQAEVNQFKLDDRMGKYDEATSQLKWNDLLTALAENRIR